MIFRWTFRSNLFLNGAAETLHKETTKDHCLLEIKLGPVSKCYHILFKHSRGKVPWESAYFFLILALIYLSTELLKNTIVFFLSCTPETAWRHFFFFFENVPCIQIAQFVFSRHSKNPPHVLSLCPILSNFTI